MTSLTSGHVASQIKNAIKKLKNGKAAGCDNVPPEAIKAGGDTSEEVLLDFCNRVWTEEKIPEEWRKGLLIKLPKKSDLSYCKNWRGIMLLNMASKVFCRAILERIKPYWPYCRTIQDIRDKTPALEVQSAKVGLKINATKTKFMHIGTKRDNGVSVLGGPIKEVDEFIYPWEHQ